MKKSLLRLSLTLLAGGTSIYLATLPTPTDAQKDLSNTANEILRTGIVSLFFRRRDHDDEQNAKK